MKNKTKIALIATPFIAGGVAFKWHGYMNWLQEEYPEHDPKVLSRAFRTMMKRGVTGKYKDVDLDHDGVMQKIFEEILKEQTAS